MSLPDVWGQIVQTLGAAGITYAGVRFTGKRAERAHDQTQGSADLKAAADEWRGLKDEYASRLDKLEEKADKLERELSDERHARYAVEDQLATFRRRVHAFTRWMADLSENWETYRQRDRPPDAPDLEEER